MFKNTQDNKRYYTLNYYFRKKFNSKVFKIPLDANMSCPNKESGGCIYCKDSSSASIINSADDILKQFENAKTVMLKKWPNSKYIAYFQAGTNTFDTVDNLKKLYESVIDLPNVVGISIATRPDSITEDVLKYLEKLNKKTYLTIELGLQSSKEETLKLINRGHTAKDLEECVRKLRAKNIYTVVHIINGLPYESKEDMINTAKYLNSLKINGIKIHMLYIAKDTALETLYKKKKFHVLTKEEYIDITIDQLEHLNENIVIERITGDPVKEDLIEPQWLVKKFCVLNDIDKEMVKRNTYQGVKETSNS